MIQQIDRILSRWLYAASLLSLVAVSAFVGESHAQADEQRWGFGSDLGLTAGTVNGTVFTLGFNADYYIDRNFSIGPMMQIRYSSETPRYGKMTKQAWPCCLVSASNLSLGNRLLLYSCPFSLTFALTHAKRHRRAVSSQTRGNTLTGCGKDQREMGG